jgi:hypothetical protein
MALTGHTERMKMPRHTNVRLIFGYFRFSAFEKSG